MTFGIITLGITTLNKMTLNIMILSITLLTLSTQKHYDIQHTAFVKMSIEIKTITTRQSVK